MKSISIVEQHWTSMFSKNTKKFLDRLDPDIWILDNRYLTIHRNWGLDWYESKIVIKNKDIVSIETINTGFISSKIFKTITVRIVTEEKEYLLQHFPKKNWEIFSRILINSKKWYQ